MRWLSLLVLALPAFFGTGCSAADFATGRPGVDVSSLGPGVPRSEVEARLGAPVRSWTSTEGVHYSLYRFDKGMAAEPREFLKAVAVSVYTLGLFEILWANSKPGVDTPVIVSYDANDKVLGFFDEEETLSIDGRSNRRPKAFER